MKMPEIDAKLRSGKSYVGAVGGGGGEKFTPHLKWASTHYFC
jgi:hypothetical protein